MIAARSSVRLACQRSLPPTGKPIFLGLSVSHSWPPRQGAYGVACDRFATLDPSTAHSGYGAYEEDGSGDGIGESGIRLFPSSHVHF
jgi:hypothetical protein